MEETKVLGDDEGSGQVGVVWVWVGDGMVSGRQWTVPGEDEHGDYDGQHKVRKRNPCCPQKCLAPSITFNVTSVTHCGPRVNIHELQPT